MPRPKSVIPAYLLHKPTGQARVRINGRDHYLGPFGSDESRRRYGELVAKHSSGRPVDPFQRGHYHDSYYETPPDPGPSIAELCVAFMDHAAKWYVKNGRQTDEVDCYNSAVKVLTGTYGLSPVAEFGPNELRAARDLMIAKGWSRGFINRQVNRIRHIVKWGIGRDMVPPDVLLKLQAVEPLMAGRTTARETRARGPVSAEQIAACKKQLRSKKVKALIDLQLYCGARPGELVSLTTSMIDRTNGVWTAAIADHKMAHKGTSRVLVFGPQAQKILQPFLNEKSPDAPLFKIRRCTYSNLVRNACLRAGIEPFVPHELRHTALTLVRDTIGVEAAQALAGHSKADTTALYTKRLAQLAESVAAKCG